jgi:hypothetical protein
MIGKYIYSTTDPLKTQCTCENKYYKIHHHTEPLPISYKYLQRWVSTVSIPSNLRYEEEWVEYSVGMNDFRDSFMYKVCGGMKSPLEEKV